MTHSLGRWRAALSALVAGALMLACSQDNAGAPPETGNAPPPVNTEFRHPLTGEVLAERQLFRHRLSRTPVTLDPHQLADPEAAFIVRDLFEGLLSVDPTGQLLPGVAERYEISDDFQTWTFHLRDDALWSDGRPVTARDFVFAWRRAVNPEHASPHAWYFSLMGVKNSQVISEGSAEPASLGVSAVDENTLEVQLTRPTPYLGPMVTQPVTFPLPEWTLEAQGETWLEPGKIVGNGAFVLAERDNDTLVRVRNERYWDGAAVHLDRVEAIVLDDDSALALFDAGELDQTDLPPRHYARLLEERPAEVGTAPLLCTYDYTFNTRSARLKDARVRRALAFAIDRTVITGRVLQGPQQPAYTLTPVATAGFTAPDAGWAHLTQAERETRAKTLMSEAGFGADKPLHIELLHNTGTPHREIAQAVASMWRRVLGVNTTLVEREWSAFLARRQRGDFDVARGGWCGDYNEASAFLNQWHSQSGYNAAQFQSTDYDLLLRQSQEVANPTPFYTQMERLLADLMPAAPVYHYSEAILLKPRVAGWPMDEPLRNLYSKHLYLLPDD